MATAVSIHPSFLRNNRSILRHQPNVKRHLAVSCRSRGPADRKEGEDEGMGEKQQQQRPPWILRIFGKVGKLGEGLRESLSPKRKGDWKDVMLMSFSFAVYVYISQKIVCAYCAWMQMLKFP
ncbi:hypothetical protein ACLOJK_016091 [Asimina triloba]